jgi:hypothetical protein
MSHGLQEEIRESRNMGRANEADHLSLDRLLPKNLLKIGRHPTLASEVAFTGGSRPEQVHETLRPQRPEEIRIRNRVMMPLAVRKIGVNEENRTLLPKRPPDRLDHWIPRAHNPQEWFRGPDIGQDHRDLRQSLHRPQGRLAQMYRKLHRQRRRIQCGQSRSDDSAPLDPSVYEWKESDTRNGLSSEVLGHDPRRSRHLG